MAMRKQCNDNLESAEYMIDDVLVTAIPMTFKEFCDLYKFDSLEYDPNYLGYAVTFERYDSIFMPKYLFEVISMKSEY